ncbi:MAG: dihydroorotate dehydrogenase electron transfer subunit [Candidatus Saganbacteria bacterium]|uniref:Dihydroorotate dehydrogenase B (NAD(+)), electron transfer subunit n=1 Tax=Candidatus Saganbacteria bacterium TaxID=2575572 RepID=A0A833L0J5_UNCSA|nr:MAG: dihydroorotate dehydrogenase electron transfer subunit [Candidatus Saganbacteria bacterium]
MIQEDALVLDQKQISDKYFKLTLKSQFISNNSKPGQFVNVKVSPSITPLLRRPISIHKINKENNSFDLLYEIVGAGTEILSKRKVGEKISVLGPLGNGFTIKNTPALLVAGGMGVAPLYFLAEEMKKASIDAVILIGGKRSDSINCEEDFKKLGFNVFVTTEDGSKGEKGLIINLLRNHLNRQAIYACGPKAMLKEISKMAAHKKIGCQVSMESYMACGIGSCKGCAVKTKSGYQMACKDGPVFNAEEIIW